MRGIKAELRVQQQIKFVIKRLCFSVVCLFIIPANTEAQISPDGTLPTVVEQQENMEKITGGEREGNNLFHSFEEFSVPEGIEAIFENGLDVENIFTRITGESASTINGILRTQGGANFFLVNPNGIVFGENAQLDVGGSFIATTANTIQFSDGTEFIASDAEAKPVLTVSVPIGLGFSGDSGAITVNGKGNQITSDTRFSPIEVGDIETGISVNPGKTLALIGGNINFPGGIVTAEEGKIEIGSVDTGLVSFQDIDNELAFSYENATSYQDIALSQQALLDASGEGSGAISLTGNNISLSNSSFILIQNRGQIDSGTLNINANESLTLSGTLFDREVSSGIRSESLGTGQGAKINVSTEQLQLQDGAQIISSVHGQAPGSDVSINASNFIEMFGSSISSGTFDRGNAGNVQISTARLEIMEGGSVSSSTIGSGSGGKVTINADLIDVVGRVSIDRSNIAAVSFGPGNAGSLNINTKRLRVRDQAIVNTSSRASGDAGGITINASESIEVSGTNKNFQSTIRAGVELTNSEARKIFGLPEVPSGNAGNVTINSPVLNLIQEGVVNVSNEGTGDAGTLSIDAEEINLFDRGSITAASASGTGGNIKLNVENLQIDTDSEITAAAENDGDGGNIIINTTSLIAKKNSQVTANAFGGRGGNIDIEVQGLFLFDSPDQFFSASSELGIDGRVNINTTNNFQNSFESISPEFIVAEEALQGSCLTRRNSQQGSFVYGGTGGLPASPDSAIDEEPSLSSQLPEVQPDLETSGSSDSGAEDNSSSAETIIYPAQTANQWQVGDPIIEPTNLIKTADGRLLWVRKQADNASSLICQ